MLLSGQVAIVAGAAGLGRSVTRAFAREGAAVVVGDPREGTLVVEKAEVAALGGVIRTVATELTHAADGERLVAAALDAFGRVDVVVTNAHVPESADRLAAADLGAWRRDLDAGVFAALHLARAAIPPMRAERHGSIVFVNASVLRGAAARQGAHAAASGALLTAAQVLARELGPANIRVNTIVPLPSDDGRPAAPGPLPNVDDDAGADAIVFLASDLAAVVTGQSLDVQTGPVRR